MKKYLKFIFVIAIMLVFLTGCTNVNYEVQINEDGSGDISYAISLNIDELETLGINPKDMYDSEIKDFKDKAEENGYIVEDYEDDTALGFRATKHCDDITTENMFVDLFGEIQEVKFGENNKIQKQEGTFKDEYYQQAVIDLTAIPKDEENLLNKLEVTYRIKLSTKSKNNNATNVLEGGKILEWKMKPGEINEIKFTSKKSNAYLMIGIGVSGMVLAGFVTVKVIKRKDKIFIYNKK